MDTCSLAKELCEQKLCKKKLHDLWFSLLCENIYFECVSNKA